MAISDPIADLLTMIRNASAARHRFIDVPHSNMREAIAKISKKRFCCLLSRKRREERKEQCACS